MNDRKIICLTPVKNEFWILDVFIRCTSLWADCIIIADQGSTDESRAIAQKYEKVILISNDASEYNEKNRQELLLFEARKIQGENNIFIALDADEILIGFDNKYEWNKLKDLSPGTTIFFPWLNVLPGMKTYYGARSGGMLFGYINDGKEHVGKEIHSTRLPSDVSSPRISFDEIKVLHFQYADQERLLSKHRWYECLEKIKFPEKNNIDIYRQYHHIDLPIEDVQKIHVEWLHIYDQHQIFFSDIKINQGLWWDKEVCLMFDKYGLDKFRKQAIWYVDWKAKYQIYFPEKDHSYIKDPRTPFDKWVHVWLARSQATRFAFWNKVVNKLLRIVNW